MKNVLHVPLLAALLVTACQQNEEPAQTQEKEYTVSITARIGRVIPEGRYTQTNDNTNAQFTNTDDIGVFMDGGNVTKWTFDGTSWSSDSILYWEDKDKSHTFYAYYPYTGTTGATNEEVLMPSLEGQDGSLGKIARHDFLVASRMLSYTDTQGKVSFTGDNAFKHVSSLMKITLNKEKELAGSTINRITLTGTGLFTRNTYSFADQTVTSGGASPVNTLNISPTCQMADESKSFYFIMNGDNSTADSDITKKTMDISIEYTHEGKNYKAERKSMAVSMEGGKIYQYTIKVQNRLIIITGGEISGWTPGNEEETIIIDSEEAVSANS